MNLEENYSEIVEYLSILGVPNSTMFADRLLNVCEKTNTSPHVVDFGTVLKVVRSLYLDACALTHETLAESLQDRNELVDFWLEISVLHTLGHGLSVAYERQTTIREAARIFDEGIINGRMLNDFLVRGYPVDAIPTSPLVF